MERIPSRRSEGEKERRVGKEKRHVWLAKQEETGLARGREKRKMKRVEGKGKGGGR